MTNKGKAKVLARIDLEIHGRRMDETTRVVGTMVAHRTYR